MRADISQTVVAFSADKFDFPQPRYPARGARGPKRGFYDYGRTSLRSPILLLT